MFRDEYTDFVFNDIHSSNFKVWITNSGDLSSNLEPEFKDSFNTPTGQQKRYYEGTSIDKQSFKLKCIAIDVTQNEWRAITKWLSPLTIGKLRFEWNNKHYYMVKLASAPSAVMSIGHKIDNVMGKLFTITFEVEFTTTDDWAALGEYIEVFYSEPTEDYNDIVNSSINYGNNFYMPTIIPYQYKKQEPSSEEGLCPPIDKNEDLDVDSLSKYYIGYKIILADSGVGDEIFAPDIVYWDPISYGSGDEVDTEYTLFQIKNVLNEEVGTVVYKFIEDSDTEEKTTYYYLRLIAENDEKVYVELTNCKVRVGKQYFLYNPTQTRKTLYCLDSSIIINNTGTFSMYPQFTVTDSCNIYDNNKTYYEIERNPQKDVAVYPLYINSFEGTMISGGQHAIVAQNASGLYMYNKAFNNNSCALAEGRPELFKAVFESDTDDGLSQFRTATFLINNKPIYSRYLNFTMHVFKSDFAASNIYGVDDYDENQYGSRDDIKHFIYFSPSVKYEYTPQGWKMIVKYLNWSNNNQLDLKNNESYLYTWLERNDYVYISLCDSAELFIDTPLEQEYDNIQQLKDRALELQELIDEETDDKIKEGLLSDQEIVLERWRDKVNSCIARKEEFLKNMTVGVYTRDVF